MKRAFLIYMVGLFGIAASASGYFETMATDRVNASINITGQSSNQSTALAALFPIQRANGHAGIFVQRQVGNDEVISEIAAAELEGGFDVRRFKIRGVIEVERDVHRGIEFSRQVSYFVSPPEIMIGEVTLGSGFGNFTQNVQILETLGKDAADTTFGWLAFIDAKWRMVDVTAKVEPELDLKDLQAELAGGITQAVSDELSIGVLTKVLFETNPIKGEKIHTQYTIFATWTP